MKLTCETDTLYDRLVVTLIIDSYDVAMAELTESDRELIRSCSSDGSSIASKLFALATIASRVEDDLGLGETTAPAQEVAGSELSDEDAR